MRKIFWIAVIVLLTYGAFTVDLGGRTFIQHVKRIWQTDETQDLIDGVKKKSKPITEKVKRGAEAGLKAMAESSAKSAAEDALSGDKDDSSKTTKTQSSASAKSADNEAKEL